MGATAPTRAKRALGKFLLEAREAAELTAVEAAEGLQLDTSSVTRYETGAVLPSWPTVRALLDDYGVTGDDRKVVAELYKAAQNAPPIARLPTGMSKAFRALVRGEAEAERVRIVQLFGVPALLQHSAYSAGVEAAGPSPLADDTPPERYVAVRKQRQQRLTGDNPLHVQAALDECTLWREIGGPAVLRQQLEHLLALVALPHIEVRIIPHTSDSPALLAGNCTVLHYAEPDPPTAYCPHPGGGAWLENRGDVARIDGTIDAVMASALSPSETEAWLRTRVRELVST